jgi:hypothetical protein
MSSTKKLEPTSSLNVKVKVTGPVAVEPEMSSVITTVGGVVSVVAPPPQALINKDAARAQAERLKVFANEFIERSPDWEGGMEYAETESAFMKALSANVEKLSSLGTRAFPWSGIRASPRLVAFDSRFNTVAI